MKEEPIFYVHPLDNKIPRSMEKPSYLQIYDGTEYLDEHVEHLNNMIKYVPFPRDGEMLALRIDPD